MEIEYDIENPLTNIKDEGTPTAYLLHLFHLESDHMASEIYAQSLSSSDFNFSFRRETIFLILQFSGSLNHFLSCLAVNYLDRFFSNQGMPLQAKPWVKRLLAFSCVSLATKMMKPEFSPSDFQCEDGIIFDSRTVDRMEMLILGALRWRMRSITPFAFLPFFSIFFKIKDPLSLKILRARAIEIIFKAQKEIKLLEFKPSIVAASALLSASHELFPMQFICFLKSISSCSCVNKEKLVACMNVMEGIMMDGHESWMYEEGKKGGEMWGSTTPIDVLDQQWSISASTSCLSETTDNKTTSPPNEEKEEKEERQRKRQR